MKKYLFLCLTALMMLISMNGKAQSNCTSPTGLTASTHVPEWNNIQLNWNGIVDTDEVTIQYADSYTTRIGMNAAADFIGAFNYYFNAHRYQRPPFASKSEPKEKVPVEGWNAVARGMLIFIAAVILARFTGRLGFMGIMLSFAVLFFGIRYIIKGFFDMMGRTGRKDGR